jgi:hypothetical protein
MRCGIVGVSDRNRPGVDVGGQGIDRIEDRLRTPAGPSMITST